MSEFILMAYCIYMTCICVIYMTWNYDIKVSSGCPKRIVKNQNNIISCSFAECVSIIFYASRIMETSCP